MTRRWVRMLSGVAAVVCLVAATQSRVLWAVCLSSAVIGWAIASRER